MTVLIDSYMYDDLGYEDKKGIVFAYKDTGKSELQGMAFYVPTDELEKLKRYPIMQIPIEYQIDNMTSLAEETKVIFKSVKIISESDSLWRYTAESIELIH